MYDIMVMHFRNFIFVLKIKKVQIYSSFRFLKNIQNVHSVQLIKVCPFSLLCMFTDINYHGSMRHGVQFRIKLFFCTYGLSNFCNYGQK